MSSIRFRTVFPDQLDNLLLSDAEKLTYRNLKSTFIPGITTGDNLAKRHGDIFFLEGRQALYLKNLIEKGLVVNFVIDNIPCQGLSGFNLGFSSGYGLGVISADDCGMSWDLGFDYGYDS